MFCRKLKKPEVNDIIRCETALSLDQYKICNYKQCYEK